LEAAKAAIEAYKLGNPLAEGTSLGPVALPQAPAFLHDQVKEAVALGARLLTGGAPCTDAAGKGRFFAPTLVADATHRMSIMTKESFGPVVAVAPVDSDAQAVHAINDSEYGLTAAVFTKSQARANAIGAQLAVGTVYMNRCEGLGEGGALGEWVDRACDVGC
jgi:acyl-CoA reductase-like NAD-dependent aldehyde dehydrogenase